MDEEKTSEEIEIMAYVFSEKGCGSLGVGVSGEVESIDEL